MSKSKLKTATVPQRYYKLGELASIFFNAATGLKVTKNVPGILTVPKNKAITEASAKGHIIEITEDEYNDQLAGHDVNVSENNAASKEAAKKREAAKKASKVEPEPEEEEEEETEDEDEDEEDEEEETEDEDEEEEEKPKRGRGRK